jgi:hypothetical protein
MSSGFDSFPNHSPRRPPAREWEFDPPRSHHSISPTEFHCVGLAPTPDRQDLSDVTGQCKLSQSSCLEVRMRLPVGWLLLFSSLTVPCHASLMVIAGNCWQSDGTTNFLGPQDCSIVSGTSTASTSQTKTTPDPGSPNQVYSGSASVTASTDTWKLDASTTLTDYLPGMYQYTNIDGIPFEGSPADARVVLTDGITVSGGTGVYNITYVLSVAGTLNSSGNPDLLPEFCASLVIPQGTGTNTQSCEQYGQSGFTTADFTYSNLLFGSGPITPTLELDALVATLFPPPTGSLLTASASANFADTVTLTDILITDANGNPIPGITLTSEDAYSYPLDPRNAVPEPSLLVPLCLGVCVILCRRRTSRQKVVG